MNFNLDSLLPVGLHILLDVIVIVVAGLCAWRGWRKGIIGGLCSILAILVALYGANLIASTYSGEFTGIVEPFADGIVDTVVSKVTGKTDQAEEDEAQDAGEADESEDGESEKKGRGLVVRLSGEEKEDVYSVAFAVLRQLGLHEDTAAELAKGSTDVADFVNSDLSEFLANKLCTTLAFILVFIIAFILIIIVFAVLGNVIDLVFNLPGIELVNKILGLCLGLALAFCILQFMGFVARFAGIVLSDADLQKTVLFKYFVEYNYIASFIGM